MGMGIPMREYKVVRQSPLEELVGRIVREELAYFKTNLSGLGEGVGKTLPVGLGCRLGLMVLNPTDWV